MLSKLLRRSMVFFATFAICASSVVLADGVTEDKDALPADIVVHVQSGPIDEVIKDLEELAVKSTTGTGVMLPIQPGMGVMFLPQVTMLPNTAIDMKRGIEVVVTNEGKIALLLPVNDFQNQLTALKGAGMATETGNGTVKITNPMAGGETYMIEADAGYVVSSHEEDTAKKIAEIAKAWKREALSSKSTSVCTVDTAKLLRLNKDKIDQEMADLEKKIVEESSKENQSPFIKQLALVAPTWIKDARVAIEQTKTIRIYSYADKNRLRFSGYLVPQEKSTLEAIAKSYSSSEPEYALMKFLPKEAVFVECINTDPKVFETIRPIFSKLLSDFANILDKEKTPELMASIDGMMDSIGGNGVVAIIPSLDGMSQTSVAYTELKDPAAYQKSLPTSMEQLRYFVAKGFDQIGDKFPAKIWVNFKENAGKAEGLDYSEVSYEVEIDKTKMDGQNRIMEMQITQITNTMAKMKQLFAVSGNTLITVSGPGGEESLISAIKALKDQQPGISTRDGFMENFNALKTKQAGYGAVYFTDFFKLAQIDAMKSMPPQMLNNLVSAFKNIPPASAPVTFAIGAREKKASDTEPESYSFKYLINIPPSTITESINFFQTMQRAFMGGMGGNDGMGGAEQPAPPPGGNTF
ncbi:MAG: hypothetical protein JXR97_08370 [Planctomycetes bacterium]|nr:hypothetical protein [Planctomycetota bacterium]